MPALPQHRGGMYTDPKSALILARNNDPSVLINAHKDRAIERIRRGVYAPPLTNPQQISSKRERAVQRIHAADAMLTGQHWFSHESAALLFGWPTLRLPERLHVTQEIRPGSGRASDLIRHHHTLPATDRARVAGVPVTCPTRTAADCAMALDELEALVILDAALRKGVDRAELERRFTRLAGHRGVRRARQALALARPLAESPGETITRYRFHQLGWPEPQLQIPVQTPNGTYFLDMGWPQIRLGVEYDGEVKYRELAKGDPGTVVIKEKRRGDDIDGTGWTLTRVMKDNVSTATALGVHMQPHFQRARRRATHGF